MPFVQIMEKILNKIKNLLDLANNNPSENEAIAAALKAQELMAKYNIEMEQLEDVEKRVEEIAKVVYNDVGNARMKKWKYGLAGVVAKNFRCKYYLLGNTTIVFYGHKTDAQIAHDVFATLYEMGNKLALSYYNKCRNRHLPTKGVMNTYLIGFRDGVKNALDKQCVALMIVTPKDVETTYGEMTKNWDTKDINIKTLGRDNEAYNLGVVDGRNAANQRALSA